MPQTTTDDAPAATHEIAISENIGDMLDQIIDSHVSDPSDEAPMNRFRKALYAMADGFPGFAFGDASPAKLEADQFKELEEMIDDDVIFSQEILPFNRSIAQATIDLLQHYLNSIPDPS